jgi:F-type H+-transporting ATPase subunit a
MINNPLEQFEILKLIGMEGPLLGYLHIALTNSAFYILLGFFFIVTLHSLSTKGNLVGRGNTYVLSMESLFGFVQNMVKSQLGTAGLSLLPACYALFLFIIISNLLGLVPYSFTVTAQFALALALSCTVLLGATLLGLDKHGLRFFSLFVPAGTPLALVPLLVIIESISYLARAVSLGVRLSANMIAGHILLKLIASFSWKFITGSLMGLLLAPLPLLFIILLFGLELGVALIQAYVFVLLTCSYIKDVISLHE